MKLRLRGERASGEDGCDVDLFYVGYSVSLAVPCQITPYFITNLPLIVLQLYK